MNLAVLPALATAVALSVGTLTRLTSTQDHASEERTTSLLLDDYISFEVSYVETDPNGFVVKYESPTPNQQCYAKATWRISDMKLISIDCL